MISVTLSRYLTGFASRSPPVAFSFVDVCIYVCLYLIIFCCKIVFTSCTHRSYKLTPPSKNNAFGHAQNLQSRIIWHVRKSSGHLLSAKAVYSIKWFCLWTAKALMRSLIRAFTVRICPKIRFTAIGAAKISLLKRIWHSLRHGPYELFPVYDIIPCSGLPLR